MNERVRGFFLRDNWMFYFCMIIGMFFFFFFFGVIGCGFFFA